MTNKAQRIIDVHMHCFTGLRQADAILADLTRLRQAGMQKLVVVGMVNTHLDREAMWNLIPDFVENQGDPRFYEVDDLLGLTRLSGEMIVPLVDTRHLWGEVEPSLAGYIRRGFRGIKGIYLQDDGNDLGVRGVPETLGITLAQYQRREWEICAFAEANDLPLLYHMDARRHGDLMEALLRDFPKLRVVFAHYGIGRKAFSGILDSYPNVFTDMAGMISHMRENPAGYRDFIMRYPDRVCFATDALLYQGNTVLEYLEMVKELKLPEEVEAQILYGNGARFLGEAIQRKHPTTGEKGIDNGSEAVVMPDVTLT